MKNNYILLVPDEEKKYVESLNYSFGKKNIEVVSKEMSEDELNKLVSKINDNYSKVIFFDYSYKFYVMLPLISKKVKVCWIYKYPISYFFISDVYNYLLQIIEYKNRKLIDEIYTLDYSLYKLLNKKHKFKYLMLDVPQVKKAKRIKTNTIGIIGMDFDETANFYNSLSAATFYDFEKVKIENTMNATINFAKDFNLNIEKMNSYQEVLSGNDVNLYCSFSNIIVPLVLKSLDMGIPCIVGNTDMFDSNKTLKEFLVLKSDDDINEIAEKIKSVIENRELILKEYEVYRTKYSSKAQSQIQKIIPM